ncbi:hypothetical protein ACFXGA_21335 [Actinosynnema sp. NPDC059335]|uniref:hypothetical protein n=1 Tax=Actinosynnema sp. NPDC059335 TaxID=3346804 RepID=UPI00366A8A17
MGSDGDDVPVTAVRREETEGGDPVCRLSRVCPECGALDDGPARPVCPRCGATLAEGGGAR